MEGGPKTHMMLTTEQYFKAAVDAGVTEVLEIATNHTGFSIDS